MPASRVVDRTDAPANLRSGALRALRGMHEAAAVDGLIARLEKETDATRRRGLLSALARLYNDEGVWTGNSWGTHPDSTGPYFQPEPWDESPKIAAALKKAVGRRVGRRTGLDPGRAASQPGPSRRHASIGC